jgi:cytochrome P450
VVTALDVVVARAQLPVQPPAWLPTPGNRRLRTSLRELDAAVHRLVAARRRHPGGDDVLGLLLRARDAGVVTDRQVRDEVVTLIVAGHETVAATLTWTWSLLSGDAAATRRVRAEAGGLPAGRLELAALDDLPYTRAVVDECLRLYPPAWLISRRALAPDVLSGYQIPQGTVVIMSPTLVHRDPGLWPDPDTFDPGRFVGSRRDEVDRRGYLPFGAGPRLCIGRDFALLEAVVLIARLVGRFDVQPVDPGPVRVHRGVTGRPEGGLPSRVRVVTGG